MCFSMQFYMYFVYLKYVIHFVIPVFKIAYLRVEKNMFNKSRTNIVKVLIVL